MFKYNLQKTTKKLIFNIYLAAENYHGSLDEKKAEEKVAEAVARYEIK